MKKKIYPVISIFVESIHPIRRENQSLEDNIIADASLDIFTISKISAKTKELSFNFANELINYFTPDLLMHHHQDEVPIFTIYLGINEYNIDINTYGGYYTRFIETLPSLNNMFGELLNLVEADLDINESNIKDIIMELEDTPRLDVKENFKDYHEEDHDEDYYSDEGLNWTYTRTIRTPHSEVYALYLNNEAAGEIHIHIGGSINTTIITTLDVSEKEKAELMGHVHEILLESLEEELGIKSTIMLYSEAIDDV